MLPGGLKYSHLKMGVAAAAAGWLLGYGPSFDPRLGMLAPSRLTAVAVSATAGAYGAEYLGFVSLAPEE